MKKHIIISGAFLLGAVIILSAALYPFLADYINAHNQTRAVAHYFSDVAALPEEDMKAYLEAAHAYNRELTLKADRFAFTEDETRQYKKLLSIDQDVMGLLSIDKINVNLPIYHGTDQGTLQVGLGHMQGTSLPVGGAGTHAFITGHRGVPTSTLLTDLGQMAEGDSFALYVMGETLTYEVDQIRTVEPHAVRELDIEPGMDYCTLVTCTPYGVNSHRLLVRGRRVENTASPGWETIYAEARRLDKPMALLLLVIPAWPVWMISALMRCRKTRRKGAVTG
ncbi:MAG: class C sortase [Oscillospiraceae bacterium]|nr:class C sortase [Oscillospiraceae bacterium]